MRLQRYGFFFVTRYLSVEKILFLTIFYHFPRFLLCFFLFFYKERCAFFVYLRFFKAILQTVNNFFVTLQRLHKRFQKRVCLHKFLILRFLTSSII